MSNLNLSNAEIIFLLDNLITSREQKSLDVKTAERDVKDTKCMLEEFKQHNESEAVIEHWEKNLRQRLIRLAGTLQRRQYAEDLIIKLTNALD